MLEHPGFKLYSRLVDDQRRNRVKEIISMEADSLDDLIALGNAKKELAGIQFSAKLPELMIEDLEDEIREVLDLLRSDDDED